ncbi:hypothetical protein D3C78_382530 [compost metagenome]
MLIERVARGGRVVQHLPVVGATGLIHRHGGPVDVLGLASLEHHLLPVVEGRDAPRGPEQVVGHGRIALFPAVAVLEVVVRPHVVVLEEGDELGGIPIDPVHGEDPPHSAKAPLGDVVTEGGEEGEVQHRETRITASARVGRVRGGAGVPPGADHRGGVVVGQLGSPAGALDQVLAEHEQPRLVGLPVVHISQQFVPLYVLEGIDADGIHPHVEVLTNGAVEVILDVLVAGGEIDAIPRHVLALQGERALPVAAGHEAVQVIPAGIQGLGIDAKEAVRVVACARHCGAGLGVHQGLGARRIGLAAGLVPVGSRRVVIVTAVGAGVVPEVALIGPIVDEPLAGACRHVIFDRQAIDPGLATQAVLAGVVDHHILYHLDPLGVGGLDELPVARPRRLQPGIDPVEVVGVIAVIVEAGAVLHRRRHPDGGEAEILDVVELLDEPLEVATPVGIPRLVAVAVMVVVAPVPIVEAGGQQEIDALATKIAPRHRGLANLIAEALLPLIAGPIDTQCLDHQIGAAALVTGDNGLAGVAGGRRGGLAAVRGEMDSGGAVIIVAHREGDGLRLCIAARGRGGGHSGRLVVGASQGGHLQRLVLAIEADAVTGVGTHLVVLGRVGFGPVPLAVNLEAGIAAAKGLLGTEGHSVLADHGGQAPVVGSTAEIPAAAGLGGGHHQAHAAAALGPLIVGDRQAIGEGARLSCVDADALRALAAAPEVAGNLAIGIRGVAAAQDERIPHSDIQGAARGDDSDGRLIVVPERRDAVGLGLVIDLEAHRSGAAPEDVAAAALQHTIGVAVAEVDGPVPRLIELEPLVGLAIHVGFGLPQVVGHQRHGQAGPAIEGAAHLKLRQRPGKPRGLATRHRRGGDGLGAGMDADLIGGIGSDRVVGARVALLPVAVSVDFKARAAAGVSALEELTGVKVDPIGRHHGGRRPSIRGAPEEPLRRRARRRDQGSQQSGREYPSSH